MNAKLLAPLAAIGAMVLALVVALAGRAPAPAGAGTDAWPALVEAGADHISPAELADRLLTDPGSVLLVDVRPAEEFASFHLPGAANLDVAALLGERGDEVLAANEGKLVVLCSNGMTHPAQAWVELARRGRSDIRILEDGIDGFIRDVLTPPSLRGPTTEARAAKEQAAFAVAAKAFLGRAMPLPSQAGPPPAPPRAETPAIQRLATDPPALSRPTVVSAEWVARRGAEIVLLDARDKPEEYAAGHLPGARHAPISLFRSEQGGVGDQLLPADELAALIGRLGIDAGTEVVAYGDAKLQDPAHAALALISLGHERVAILEGGLAAWKAGGRALSTEAPAVSERRYAPRPAPGFRAAPLEEVARASREGTARILDVRPAEAFRGEGASTEARAGHIPGSTNRPYTSDIANEGAGPFWRPLEELRREYAALGLDPAEPVIVSCRTGHQASQTWFTLRYLLGHEDVRWYDGSWKEWAAHPELPAATGGE